MLNVPDSIKELFHTDSVNKNIRIHFPNGERSDICNDLIVKDTVSFTESLCSQNTLKFGLCESPVFECEVVGVGNVKGATIEVFCEIECESDTQDAIWQADLEKYIYQIPLGKFIVKESKRQSNMTHRKIVAYNFVYMQMESGFNEKDNFLTFFANIIDNVSNSLTSSFEEILYSAYPCFFNEYNYSYMEQPCVPSSVNWSSYTRQRFDSFYIPGESYNSVIYKKSTGSIKPYLGDGWIGVVNFDDIHIYSKAEIEQLIDSFAEKFYLKYPNAKDVNDHSKPYDIKSALKNYFFNDVAASNMELQARRFMRVNNNLEVMQIYPIPSRGRYVFVNNGETYQITKHLYSPDTLYHFHVGLDESPDFEEDIGLVSNDSKTRSVKISTNNVPITPLILNKKADNGTYSDRYNTYNFSGYSAREALSEIDINKIADGLYEYYGLFCKPLRSGLFDTINIKQRFNLLPSSTLYPETDLYPESVIGGKLLPQDYQTCWYDDEYTRPYGAVKCEYINTSNESCSYTLYLSGFDEKTNLDAYQAYELANNYIIGMKTWTEVQINNICNAIANNISGVTYMPVEFVGRGLPYVEAGDTFQILTKNNDSITTIVLNRTIKGEQHLVDSYRSV